jgi:hypothetical protein
MCRRLRAGGHCSFDQYKCLVAAIAIDKLIGGIFMMRASEQTRCSRYCRGGPNGVMLPTS